MYVYVLTRQKVNFIIFLTVRSDDVEVIIVIITIATMQIISMMITISLINTIITVRIPVSFSETLQVSDEFYKVNATTYDLKCIYVIA